MNITHAVHEEVTGNVTKAIFDRQKELMAKYHDIELKSGLLQTEECPVNLNDKKGQARLKDFAWRVMEELGEALDADYDDDVIHFKEELVDGLHFLTEMAILSGFDYNTFVEDEDDTYKLFFESGQVTSQALSYRVTKFVRMMGMTCNCLKNKPWKQSQMITDVKHFRDMFVKATAAYISIMAYVFNDYEELSDTYFKKSQVNKFRQRTNY